MKEIYLGGGCFWGAEKYLASIHGVRRTQVGYANGGTEAPCYEDVCAGSGHAEVVKVIYDETALSLPFLLALYYDAVDPLSVNRQGGDIGVQYRTGIYYTDAADAALIGDSLQELSQRLGEAAAIEAGPLQNYCPAEERHQAYLDKNPGGYCHIPAAKFQKAAQSRVDPKAYRRWPRAALEKRLTPRQFDVTQNGATEPPFQNEFWDEHRRGVYVDITSGEPLFTSAGKFDSGCGWPSFSAPIDPAVLAEAADNSHDMQRVEVRSRVGGAHLGHVFTDGPKEHGGLRYCINSACLRFVPLEEMDAEGYGSLKDLAE